MKAFVYIVILALNILNIQNIWANIDCNNQLLNFSIDQMNLTNVVEFAEGITAHPLDEEVNLVIPTSVAKDNETKLIACARWQPRKPNQAQDIKWVGNLPLHVISSKNDEAIISIKLPKDKYLGDNPATGTLHHSTVDIRLIASKGDKITLDNVLSIHTSSPWVSFIIALLGAVIFWFFCFQIADRPDIKVVDGEIKPGDKIKLSILKVITNKYGYASLSQFQIMLWTFVIGACGIYVMTLTGSLIEIKGSMLILLGGAGVVSSLVAIKPTGTSDTGQIQQTTQTLPTAVLDLQTLSTNDTQVILLWKPATTAEHYQVQYKTSNVQNWTPFISATTESIVIITGLTANTEYDFQVSAVNNAGSTNKILERVKTASAIGTTPEIIQITSPNQTTENSIQISWQPPNINPDCYVVRYREIDTALWLIGSIADGYANTIKADKLHSNTEYEIEVLAIKDGRKLNVLKTDSTTQRVPTFSDLLMASNGKEIDVSRIQMMFFTVIAASFVVLKVFYSHELPEIPDGILTLMGISNGVYLAAKFTP